MPIWLTLSFQQLGLLGEQTADDSVWITKTHYPFTLFKETVFHANKNIYITRHPIDVLPSSASLFLMQAHSIEPLKPWHEYEIWPRVVNSFVPLFKDFHRL